MENYSMKTVTVELDEDNFVNQIPTELLKEKGLSIIPFEAYNVLKVQLKNEEKNNYTFVNAYIEIVKAISLNNGEEISSTYLHKISNDYKEILDLLFNTNIIKYKSNGYYDKANPINSKRAIYTMNRFSKYTFISLCEEDGVVLMDINIDHIKDTPLDNDQFINTLMGADIYASEAILAEYNHCKKKMGDDMYNRFVCRVNAILNFMKYRFAKKGESVDRIFSSFSNLSNISRKFIHFNGRQFYEIDIKNCQPLLLIVLLIEKGINIDTRYRTNIIKGKFYESLMEECQNLNYIEQYVMIKNKLTKLDLTNRDDIKTLCYSEIFFTNKLKNSSIVTAFKNLYPLVYNAILELTQDSTLASQLQNLEADIVLNIIPKCNYYTVHDAIYILNKSEIETIKMQLAAEIRKRSCGRIENVMFGEIEDFKIEMIDKNNIDPEVFNFTKIRSSKLVKSVHTVKEQRYNEFLINFNRYDKNDLCKLLSISDKTFYRYKKMMNSPK